MSPTKWCEDLTAEKAESVVVEHLLTSGFVGCSKRQPLKLWFTIQRPKERANICNACLGEKGFLTKESKTEIKCRSCNGEGVWTCSDWNHCTFEIEERSVVGIYFDNSYKTWRIITTLEGEDGESVRTRYDKDFIFINEVDAKTFADYKNSQKESNKGG